MNTIEAGNGQIHWKKVIRLRDKFDLKPFVPRIISFTVAIIGLIILINSVDIGIDLANQHLRNRGGSMNADDFRILQTNHINTYRWVGGILLFVGGLHCLRRLDSREWKVLEKLGNKSGDSVE